MSNFLKSLFGAKKAAKVTKSRMQTRRLELIGLEERITPAATLSLSAGGVLSLTASGATAAEAADDDWDEDEAAADDEDEDAADVVTNDGARIGV